MKSKFNRFYGTFDDKLAKTTLVYGDADNGNLFLDKTHKTKLTFDEVLALFLVGMTVVYDNGYYNPVQCKDSGTTMDVVVYDGTIKLTFKSDVKKAE